MWTLDSLLSIIALHSCMKCGKEGSLLCSWCELDAFPTMSPRCYRCSKFSGEFSVCSSCKTAQRPSALWVVAAYDKTAKHLVHDLKFSRNISAAKIMSRHMANVLPEIPTNWVVTHTPTATSRRRQRGYDQSELLAKGVAKRKALSHKTLLARKGQSRQVGSTKKQRELHMSQAFYCPAPDKVKGQIILLVDDLVTTGATIEAATKTLKRAGAKNVYALTFAQKI